MNKPYWHATLCQCLRPWIPLVLASCLPSMVWAQAQSTDTQSPPWYQIEVIFFTYDQTNTDEIWRSDIALAYPPNWVQLKDPDAVITQASESAIENPDTATTESPLSGIAEISDNSFPEPSAPIIDLAREPFYYLPSEEQQLNKAVQNFRWAKNLNVLFHQAWRQPVLDKEDAPSIIVSAGGLYGQHHELEGSFSIHVSRYLHLTTNLWLTKFVNNYGQDQGIWPELPIRPDLRDYNLPAWSGDTETSLWEQFTPINDDYDRILETPFLPERIIKFKQKRRMRSREIHYIDHPLMGMVILIEPYDVPPPKTTDAVGTKSTP